MTICQAPEGSTISETNDLPRTGDSALEWSINTPKDMFMSERSYDGTETIFNDDSYNVILISVIEDEEKFESYEDLYYDALDSFSGYTLITADKLTDENGNVALRFMGRNAYTYTYMYVVFANERQYALMAIYDLNASNGDSILAVAESFSPTFGNAEITYDLASDADASYSEYSSSALGISFMVPLSFAEGKSSSPTALYLYSQDYDSNSYISAAVYSISESVSASSLARRFHDCDVKYANSAAVEISDVSPVTSVSLGDNAFYYTLSGADPSGLEQNMLAFFVDKGDYCYLVCVYYTSDEEEMAQSVLDSFRIDDVSDTFGTILAANLAIFYPEDEFFTVSEEIDSNTWSLSVPRTWMCDSSYTRRATLSCRLAGSTVYLSISETDDDFTDLASYAEEDFEYYAKDNAVVSEPELKKYGDTEFYVYGYAIAPNTSSGKSRTTYYTTAICEKNGFVYEFDLVDSALYHGGKTLTDFEEMLSSFSVTQK